MTDRSLRAFAVFAPLVFAALSTGCASTQPQVASAALPLRRVVVYRNGVGYFERAGLVQSNEVRFRVRQPEVGDFLATMAVLETGGSSVKSASFPLKVDDAPADVDDDPDQGMTPYLKPIPPPKPKKDPNGLVTVVLALDGKQHQLQVGYVAETPVWRPSYRLVIQQGGQADLQAWGIVQNLSGEDWGGVSLSLIAGAPLAFQPTLGDPVIPPRPIVTDSGEVISAVPQSETSLAQAPPAPPPPPPPMAAAPAASEVSMKDSDAVRSRRAEGGKEEKKGRRSAPKTAGYAGRGAPSDKPSAKADYGADDAPGYPMAAPAPAYAPPRESVSGPRNLASLAAVAVEGSSTRYDIPGVVTVPDKSATMVMLLANRVSGESVFLFAPAPGVAESSAHPFRVARFTNQTPGLLERGPIAVFEDGAFLGEGMVDPLPPGATTTVPFALERAIAVDQDLKVGEEGARVAHIEGGELTIERDYQYKSTYRVTNGSDKVTKLLVKHLRRNGTRLFQPPAGTEDNVGTGSALLPMEIGSKGSAELLVDERQTMTRNVDWLSQLADDAVRAYIADSRADQTVAPQLKKAWEIRPQLVKSLEEERALQAEESELERSTNETRENLKSIEKNNQAAELRRQLTDRLTKASARLNDIQKRTVEVRLAINEARVRFLEQVRAIKLSKGLPPPT